MELHARRVDVLRGPGTRLAVSADSPRASDVLAAVGTLSPALGAFVLFPGRLGTAESSGLAVLRILAFAEVVLLGAAGAAAVATAGAQLSASLRERHHANASSLLLVWVLAHFAALPTAQHTYLYLTSFFSELEPFSAELREEESEREEAEEEEGGEF